MSTRDPDTPAHADPVADLADGRPPLAVAAADAAHAVNNLAGLLAVVEDHLDGPLDAARLPRAREAVAAASAKALVLSAGLNLLALQPAQVAAAAQRAPRPLRTDDLERVFEVLKAGGVLCDPRPTALGSARARIDRHTLQCVLLCAADVLRRRQAPGGTLGLHAGRCGDERSSEWVLALRAEAAAGASPPGHARASLSDHALAHAARVLPPLGLAVADAGPGGIEVVVSHAPAAAAPGAPA